MSFTIIKLPAEPIVLIRLRLDILADKETTRNLRAQIVRYREATEGSLYMVWDLGQEDIAAGDVQLLLYDAQEQPGGTIADPRLRTVIVSIHPVIGILRRKVRQQFGIDVRQFTTMDEALGWVREQLHPPDADQDGDAHGNGAHGGDTDPATD